MSKLYAKKKEDRRIFSYEEKMYILNKANGVCAHCGTKIFIPCGKHIYAGHTFTTEHYIPISRGGTNDMSNVVPLCYECNKDKDDSIYDPRAYLKYIKPQYLEEVNENFQNYIKKYEFLNKHNFLYCDAVEFRSTTSELRNHLKKRGSSNKILSKTFTMKKARYDDLDRIYYFYLDYLKKYHGELSLAKQNISDWYRNGAIYYGECKKELKFFIYVGVSRTEYDGLFSYDLEVCPIFMYQSREYTNLLDGVLARLINEVSKKQNLTILPMHIYHLKNDTVFDNTIMAKHVGPPNQIENLLCYTISVHNQKTNYISGERRDENIAQKFLEDIYNNKS